MRQTQSNYLNMAGAVMPHFDNHAEAWLNVRTVATGVAEVHSATDAVNAAALKQNENNPAGYTASKEQTRDLPETTVYFTALRVRSYAGATGSEVLAQKTQFLLLMFFSVIIFNSCSPKEEEYVANIRVINNSNSIIKNFILKADVENKIIETLELNEEYEFQVKWIGRSSSILSSMDNSYIFLEITYSIDNKIFDITNEKGAFIDNYGNYYSEKTITDGSKINIKINNDDYEIIYEH
jgi:hypothetical protein